MNQEEQYLLDELQYDVKRRDSIKAITLTAHLKEGSAELHKQFIKLLKEADSSFVSLVLAHAVRAGAGKSFVDAIIDLYREKAEGELLRRKLREADGKEIEVLLEALDDEAFRDCAWELVDLLRCDTTKNIIMLTIDRIGGLRFAGAVDELTELMYSLDKQVVARSIKALGMMENTLAANRLGKRLGKDSQLDLLILKTLTKFTPTDAAPAFSHALLIDSAIPRNFAKSKLISWGKESIPALLENLQANDPDLLIHSLDIIGEIGDPSMVRPVVGLLAGEIKDPNVRFAAYQSLGLIAADADLRFLAAGLHDPVENVRFAAAFAMERCYSATVSAGITNLMNSDPAMLENIIGLVLACRLPKLFADVMLHPTGAEIALRALKHPADEGQWEFFRSQLIELGYRERVAELEDSEPSIPSEGPPRFNGVAPLNVWAIDDSKMILMAYRAQLESLGCRVRCFENPIVAADTFANLGEQTQPDLVFTDLNMPGLTGVELITRIRHYFSSYELPVVLVTTQKTQNDKASALAAGANDVLNKPFTREMLKEVLEQYAVQEVDL